MTATAWSPNPNTVTQANANGLVKQELKTAVAGQQLFVIESFAYAIDTGSLQVFKNGLILTRNQDYLESGISQVTLSSPAAEGDKILIIGFVGITGNATNDAILRADLLAQGGANKVGASGGKSVQAWIDLLKGGEAAVHADLFLNTDNPIMNAIAALPATGGTVILSSRRYPPARTDNEVNYVSKPNLRILGAKMPAFSANCDRLVGGSIIEGRFNVFADNFEIQDVGFDAGKYVMDTYYPGYDSHAPNHPNGGGATWDGFAFAQPSQNAPLALRKGFIAKNLCGLLRDSASYGHAVLIEGVNGGVLDNVIGMYGIHGLVIKSKNIDAGFIAGYGASTNHVIFKSDTYAHGGNIKVSSVEAGQIPPGTAPWSAPAQATYALFLNPATDSMDAIKIGKAKLSGATAMLACEGPVGNSLDNLMISELEIEGYQMVNAIGIKFIGVKYYRCKLGLVTINNVADGIAYSQSVAAGQFAADPLFINSLSFGGAVTLRALNALAYGRYVISHLRTTGNVNILYAVEDTARMHIGREELTGAITTKFQFNAPVLTAGWQQFAGNQAFKVVLDNYGVKFQGLLQPVGAGTPGIVSLPVYLRPAASARQAAIAKGAGGIKALMISADPGAANLTLNDGVDAIGAETYLSLQSVAYGLD